ncbi:MAG TPA: hypothetical protein EYQ22_03915 [Gammaproteobacteria bacterium]|nr:hypothetical protein [Gammaproteobacteria bacterium]HIK70254.1 hypothetical protein [Pseudomonadales bacterium]
MIKSVFLLGLVFWFSGCSEQQPAENVAVEVVEASDYQTQLQTSLLTAQRGDVITIPAGTFEFNRSLSLNVDGVTIRGAGMDQTILSFRGQISGAEGLLVTASDFIIEDLAIEDAKGDALKINEGKNIIVRRVRTEWTNGPDTANGAYGIYPVQTENTLIDGVVAIAASDAGIYVGQSRNVIVRNSRAEYNVAGIEIENTQDADVFDNIATHNTGGILVFNMPNLAQEGARTRIFRNQVIANNTANFALAGGAVAGLPAGSGISVNSNDDVEIFDNDIRDNNTAHIIISSVFSTNYSRRETASGFDPYPEHIFIHDNRYSGGGTAPGTQALTDLKVAMFGPEGHFPNIIWDGFLNPDTAVDGYLPPAKNFCVANEPETMLLNVDGPSAYANPSVEQARYQCTHEPLQAVVLDL